MKTCCKCGETKPSELFEIDRRKKYGRGTRCKDCLYKIVKVNKYRACKKCGLVLKLFPYLKSKRKSSMCTGCDGTEEFEESYYKSSMAI